MKNVKILANLEKTVSRDPDLEGQLGDLTFEVTTKARANLARHRKTGEHQITQTKGRVDHYVNLEGPAPLSVEEGHHNARTGEWVEGLHVLKDAIGE